MVSRRCLYFCEPAELVDDRAIPDHIYRRYTQLLKQSYVETGTAYSHVTLSNVGLAALWGIREDAARATLTEMRDLNLIATKQLGKTHRQIRLLVAWRGRGTDSAPEPVEDDDHNAPETRAARLGAQVTAPQAATSAGGFKGANGVRTHGDGGNIAAAAVCISGLPERTATAAFYNSRAHTREELYRLGECLIDLDLADAEAQREILALPGVTVEGLEDWVLHRVREALGAEPETLLWGPPSECTLGGGYYRKRLRAGDRSPVTMTATQRRQYREWQDRRYEAWEREEMDRQKAVSARH